MKVLINSFIRPRFFQAIMLLVRIISSENIFMNVTAIQRYEKALQTL